MSRTVGCLPMWSLCLISILISIQCTNTLIAKVSYAGRLLNAISGILAGGILGFGIAGRCVFAVHLRLILLCFLSPAFLVVF